MSVTKLEVNQSIKITYSPIYTDILQHQSLFTRTGIHPQNRLLNHSYCRTPRVPRWQRRATSAGGGLIMEPGSEGNVGSSRHWEPVARGQPMWPRSHVEPPRRRPGPALGSVGHSVSQIWGRAGGVFACVGMKPPPLPSRARE